MDIRGSPKVLRQIGNEKGIERMATGRQRTGEVVGGNIRLVRMWNGSGSPSTIYFGWMDYFSLFGRGRCFFFSVSPLLSSFSSLLCLLSCIRAVVFSLSVLRVFNSNLLLFCYLNSVSHYTRFIAQSEWVLPTPSPSTPTPISCFPLPLRSCPDRRVTAYCTNVFSSEV